MATLGTEESGHCREVETRANVWTVGQKNGCCLEVAISGGSTVYLCVFCKILILFCFLTWQRLGCRNGILGEME